MFLDWYRHLTLIIFFIKFANDLLKIFGGSNSTCMMYVIIVLSMRQLKLDDGNPTHF